MVQETSAASDLGISVLPFTEVELEGRMPGSDLIPHTNDEPWVRGVCKVITKNLEGNVKMLGTGFLFQVLNSHEGTVRGFLTCYHVATCDYVTRVEQNQITLDFQLLKQNHVLSTIQKENYKPIFNKQSDFYFMALSDKFCDELINKYGVQFISEAEPVNEELIFAPQHPEGKELHNASASVDSSWNVKRLQNWHNVSTEEGISGAPLLQQHGDEMRVIGINRGYHKREKVNLAITIDTIVQTIIANLQNVK